MTRPADTVKKSSREVLTIHEAAALLGIAQSTLRRWESEKIGPPSWRTVGGHRRYERAALTEWVRKREAG